MKKNKVGRPTKMTEETLEKLREGFLKGYNDREACLYADINPQTLYNYQEKNPEYVEQKEQFKQNPKIKAKDTVFESLENPKDAQWYLEHAASDEFSKKLETETSGAVDVTLNTLDEVKKIIDSVTDGDYKEPDKKESEPISET